MKTILIIDDEPFIRESFLDLLQEEGFQAIGAEDGETGIQLAQQHLPDLIICDVQMPELDGYDVLAQLRQAQATATIPFVFLTGQTGKAHIRQGMELGADDYLTKPCKIDEILRVINLQLQKQQKLRSQAQKPLDDLRNNLAQRLPRNLHLRVSGILDCSQRLIDQPASLDPGQVLSLAQTIHQTANELHGLIQRFLLYAELETIVHNPERKQQLQKEQTHGFKATVASVASRLAKQFNREADLSLNLNNAIVSISELQLQRMVQELIDNAFRFSPVGTPIQITSVTSATQLTLSVSNQGEGISAEQLANLENNAFCDRPLFESSAGLGLLLAKRLLEVHAGDLTIVSNPGQLTVVLATLPLGTADYDLELL